MVFANHQFCVFVYCFVGINFGSQERDPVQNVLMKSNAIAFLCTDDATALLDNFGSKQI